MTILDQLTRKRKNLADYLIPPLPFQAKEATRVGGWLSLGCALALLGQKPLLAAFLLFLVLVFDGIDGVLARRAGENNAEIDWAADRFSEFMIGSAYLIYHPGWGGIIFLLLFVMNNFLPWRRIPVLPLRQVWLVILVSIFCR
ncbi:MAG: CDP-alcohol phosphatidyltransferase family protein [bacterium]